MRASCLFLLCLLSAPSVFAQAPATPPSTAPASPSTTITPQNQAAIAEAKSYCESIDDYKKDATPQLFADAGDQPKPAWRHVGTERELESLTDAQFQHTTTAKAWLKNGSVVALETESTAGASDWLLAADYCFRPDGSLAMIRSEFRNEKDEFISVHDETYDSSGNSIGDAVQVIDLRSRRPKKISKQAAATEQRATLYKKTSDLPFTRLLKAH